MERPTHSMTGVGLAAGPSELGELRVEVRSVNGRGFSAKLRLPPNVPAKDFWSVIVYDTQTRSMLQTNQRFPTVGSQSKGLQVNADGSVDVYFGPKAPAGQEGNWVQTIPGKAWFTILRLYGPLEPWFNKTWRPDDIRRVP